MLFRSDPVQIFRYAADSYNTFKNQLINYINNTQFPNPNNARACLEQILTQFSVLSSSNAPFYYTDMAASGTNYVKATYSIQNTTYRSFNLQQTYAADNKNYNSVLVYWNGALLMANHDYTISGKTITIAPSVAIAKGDTIEIDEYASTLGCNIPATPTKLGIYPKFEPQIIVEIGRAHV